MVALRCLISNIPQTLLSDIVLATATPHIDIEIVGDVSSDADLPALMKKKSVDVLMIGADKDTLPQDINDIQEGNPDAMILCLIDDGRRTAIYLNDIGTGELEELISAFVLARKARRVEA